MKKGGVYVLLAIGDLIVKTTPTKKDDKIIHVGGINSGAALTPMRSRKIPAYEYSAIDSNRFDIKYIEIFTI